jgi:hypothetical protein
VHEATSAEEETFEALSDCAHCRVESSSLELIASRGGRGVVLEKRCRVCLREERAGSLVHEGERFLNDPARAQAALQRWALVEGDEDVARFVLAHFGGLDVNAVCARLAAGARVETSFDAIAWLFPGVGAVGGGGSTAMPEERVSEATSTRGTAPDSMRPMAVMRARTSLPPSIPLTHESIPKQLQPLRVSARALASVMLSDGEATPRDRAYLEQTLSTWGHPPLENEDLAVWRPHDLGFPHDPELVVAAMCRVAYLDGDRDATEWRVVREFARAWGVSLDAVEKLGAELRTENERGMRKVFSKIRSLFIA